MQLSIQIQKRTVRPQSRPLQKKKYCDTRTAFRANNRCTGSVYGYVHRSLRLEERDVIVYTNSDKDRQISVSSSPKNIATQG